MLNISKNYNQKFKMRKTKRIYQNQIFNKNNKNLNNIKNYRITFRNYKNGRTQIKLKKNLMSKQNLYNKKFKIFKMNINNNRLI